MTEMAGRCRAEEERKRLLALHRVILESRAEGVICVAAGEQRQVLAVNRRFLDLWGLPEHWAETGGPERLALVFQKLKDGEASEGVFETLMGDAESISENVLELCDGRFLERRSGPIRQGQAFWGRVFSYVDVTDRRRDEESLRQALAQRDALLGNSQVGLATVRGRVCVDINRRGAEILGYDREELLGQATRLIFRDEDDYLAACQEFENRLDAVGAVSAERQVRRRDGSMQNSGLGVALAKTYFSAAAALPAALFSLEQNLAGIALARWWSRGGGLPSRKTLDGGSASGA